MVVVDRPGPSLYASNSTAGQALAQFRIPENAAASLPGRRAPAWTFLHGLESGLSSTALRALRRKPKAETKAAEPKAAERKAVKKKTTKSTVKKSEKSAKKVIKKKTKKKAKAKIRKASRRRTK
jgi:nicotinate-nucleotide adenylyltransferase